MNQQVATDKYKHIPLGRKFILLTPDWCAHSFTRSLSVEQKDQEEEEEEEDQDLLTYSKSTASGSPGTFNILGVGL